MCHLSGQIFWDIPKYENQLKWHTFLYPIRVHSIETQIGDDFMKIGYIRVSTAEQNTIRQEILMKELGVD